MQEVWRGGLLRWSVVNPFELKKFSAVFALRFKIHFVGLVSVPEFLENLGTSLKIVMVKTFGKVAAVVGEIVV